MAEPADIAIALLDRVETLEVPDPVGGGFLPIAMPDVVPPWSVADPDAEPPERYVFVNLFDNRPAWEGVSNGKLDQGLLQISLVWPPNTGAIQSRLAVQAVLAHFPKNMILRNVTASVKVSGEPWASSAIIGDLTMIPVTVPWVASTIGASGGSVSPPPGGGPVATAFYDHTQTSPSVLWVVNHNLGYKPSATVLSPGGVEVIATIEHQSVNQLRVSFAVPQTGTVHCI